MDQIIRTSVLGEWDMADVGKGVKLLAVLLMAAGALLAFAGLCAFLDVFVIRRKKIRHFHAGADPVCHGICGASFVLFEICL